MRKCGLQSTHVCVVYSAILIVIIIIINIFV